MSNDPSSFVSSRGLSELDARARLKAEGYNELPRPNQRTTLLIILEILREPMLALLIGGGMTTRRPQRSVDPARLRSSRL